MPVDGFFFDSIIRQDPIDENDLDPQDNLEDFGPVEEDALAHLERESSSARATGRAVIAGFGGTGLGDIAFVPAPFLKHPKGIRDIQEWYISTLTRQDYIHRIFEKQTEIALQNLAVIHSKMGENVDIVFLCGTDFGTQSSQFCSVGTFRSLYMPYYKRMNDWIHAHTRWKTFKHSCGAVEPLIPVFIESGFDILNPVQVSASGMGPENLKKEYGRDIVFWGGGIDTQHTLMFGSPREVRNQVLKHCEIFSRDGGFVFNTVHNIQGNVPVENVSAMLGALKEFNRDG
jgi:uroporphyrinogen-III decarboxylase